MTQFKSALLAAAAVGLALPLGACETMTGGSPPSTGAQAEIDNARNQNSNGSAQPGGAGPSPSGGVSNPGTSGSISNTPGPGPK